MSIENADFTFENSSTKIIANRNAPEIELAGLKVGPFKEGVEYEVRYWVAQELVRAGVGRFREEDLLDVVKLNKVHWKECVQTVKQVAPLPDDFYPKLRRCIKDTKRKANSTPEKMAEYEKMVGMSHDIVNCRLKKIVSLASGPAQTDQFLKSLTKEERDLYTRLYEMITEWRSNILKGNSNSGGGKNE